MTTVIRTVHRIVPNLVDNAKVRALRQPWTKAKSKKRKLARLLALYSPEELKRRYEEAKALNIKHGIDPRRKRINSQLTFGNAGYSRKKVTLAKIKF